MSFWSPFCWAFIILSIMALYLSISFSSAAALWPHACCAASHLDLALA